MEDSGIIELLFQRSETALSELSAKYSRLYGNILRQIVGNVSDAEECANDVLLAIWNSIPPHRPVSLTAFVCTIAKRIGISRFRSNTSQKRNSGYLVMLSELEDTVPDYSADAGSRSDSYLIERILSDFIQALDPEIRVLFVRRYIYMESVADIAQRFEMEENTVSVKLFRARKQLKKILEKEGIRL